MFSGNNGLDGYSLKKYVFPAILVVSLFLLLLPYGKIFLSNEQRIISEVMPDHTVRSDSDVYDQSWQFWWVSYALDNGDDPRYCRLIYPPDGVSLVFQHIGWFDTYLFALTGISSCNPALSYNLSLLLGTLLTALFGWYLARSWGADRYGALFTALALVWLPSRTAHLLQHYQLANCWALIASLWLCREYLSRRNWKYYAGFAVAMLAAAFESPFLAMFAAIGMFATAFIIRASWKRTVMLALIVIIVMIISAMFIIKAPGDAGSPAMDWRRAIYWSAEPQSFILPSPFGLVGEITGMPHRLSWMSNTYEGVVTPGLIVLIAFIFIAWKKKQWRFVLIVLSLFLLSLGPELRILGRPLGIPLPFRLLQSISVLNGIRSPSRFAILGGIFVAIGGGMAIKMMNGRLKNLFIFLFLSEMTVMALPSVSADIPGICYDIPSDRTVLEVPCDDNVRRYALFQTASAYVRQYAFLVRYPEKLERVPEFPEMSAGVDMVLYHRWLFEDDVKAHYDSLYSQYFPGFTSEDSIWILDRRGVR
ncbi:MAG: hypothetical protein KAW14_05895 [Candidatus Aegiribacteria sp.]|nr:hypothetical protein [Candidatus Aegiribacteria sp.]